MTRRQAAAAIRRAAAARRSTLGAPPASSSPSSPPWWQRVPWGKVAIGAGLLGAAYVCFSGSSSEREEHENPGDELGQAEDFYRRFHWGRKAKRLRRVKLAPTPRALVELGSLEAVTYAARKGAEGLVDYVHSFGEEGGRKPVLAADPKSRRLHIVGGDYDVQGRGIVD